MKKMLLSCATLSILLLGATSSQAQIFKKLKDKVSSKIENKIDNGLDRVLDGKDSAGDGVNQTNSATTANSKDLFAKAAREYSFKPGTTMLFSDDFSKDSLGMMAAHWKTSGSGTVGQLPDQEGRWLLLREFTSYKLKSNTALPDNFTLEFDIATQSKNEAKDLSKLNFGFAHDNAINKYISDAYNDNAITATSVNYWNKQVSNASSDTKINNTIDFPLAQYAISKMHVAMEVRANHLVVYLDKVKVLDTDMFLQDSKNKYFYVSTGTELTNGALIGISNFSVAAL